MDAISSTKCAVYKIFQNPMLMKAECLTIINRNNQPAIIEGRLVRSCRSCRIHFHIDAYAHVVLNLSNFKKVRGAFSLLNMFAKRRRANVLTYSKSTCSSYSSLLQIAVLFPATVSVPRYRKVDLPVKEYKNNLVEK